MPSTNGSGKTAPKLLQDFLHFDPLRSPPSGNYLTDVTPPVGDGPALHPAQGSCKHEYTPKWNQSVAPPLDSRPRDGAEYKIAVVCKKCRVHADVHVYYPYAVSPCPNEDYPLHHFQRQQPEDEVGHSRIVYAWQCSAFQCNAQLRIAFRRPRLEPADISLLTDTEKLRRRYEAVVEEEPEREGIRQATPIDALSRLRRYIKDALNTEHTRRTFPANNKRFMEAFGVRGQECASLLNKLGFKYGDNEWALPQPPVLDDRLHTSGDSPREVLEDFEMELSAFASKLALDNNTVNPFAAEGWASAERDIERLLAAQGYTRHLSFRRTGLSNEELPYFASLGALPDFADDLVEFAYDRQSLCDPERRPYYLECLQVVAENRNTEQLQIKVATLASENIVSRRDLSAAYRALGVASSESDERVLNLYHVLISDAGSAQQDDARQALYKIGLARGSQRLIKAAQQTMDTYEDALAWLGNGASKDTADDMLLSLVALKTDDNKENEELAQKAISIIARERKSDTLNTWLMAGSTDGYDMSREEALRHLGYDGDIEKVDYNVLPNTFEFARQDRPGERTDKAIAVLQRYMANGTAAKVHPAETWPVGLESHGNTCYLNSLLQYYFSVAPLRDIVLNYDEYKLDTTKYHEKRERVGFLNISMVEIKGGQRFAEDMKHLFERMIKSPDSKVRPEQDLVCRAFLPPKDYALLASSVKADSTTQEAQPNGLESAIDTDVTDESKGSASVDDRHQSDASSVTLQANSDVGEGADVSMQDADLPPTPPDSGAEDKDENSAKPPALPPRKFSTIREQAVEKAEQNARDQQDVSDVHEKIMWRLQAGMTPKGQDEFGEQRDAIRELFEVASMDTPVENGVEGTPKSEIRTSIQLGVPTEDTNLYSLLDAVTDLQPPPGDAAAKKGVEVYRTIRSLPPILQFNIPRIMQDPITKEITKSKACIKFEDHLYMDRYCEQSGSEVLQKRKACWGWRKRLNALKKERKALSSSVTGLDGPSAVEEAAKFLDTFSGINSDLESIGMDGFDVDQTLPATLAADAEAQKGRLAVIENEIKELEGRLKDEVYEKGLKYTLAALMSHRGSQGAGHYFTFIRDFGNGLWRSYNDENVTEVTGTDLDAIYEARKYMQGQPTFAVYVRDDKKLELIQPVCRAPEKLPTPEPSEPIASGWEDVAMENGESQAAKPTGGIDPNVTVKDGGEAPWDEQRQVPKVNCLPVFRDDGLVKFSIQRNSRTSREADRDSSLSPKRRHDSGAVGDEDGQSPKHPRLHNDISDGQAVERLVESIDDTQLDGEKK